MKNKSFLGLLLFSCICLTAIAQETTKPVKAIYVNADQNILFDKLIDFVQNNEYFILSLDKQAGFIQAQKPVEFKKVFKANERRTLNFVIRPINENLSQITLNIRCEEKHWGGSESGHVYYYDDKGVSQNSNLYQNIWDELKSALVPYRQVIFTTVTTPAPTKALPAETTLNSLPKAFLKDGFPLLVERCRTVLASAYMTQKLLSEHTDIPGWEGYPVKLYEYYTGKDIKKGVAKRGLVYLLNPSAEQLATWIATTCWEVKQSTDTTYLYKLAEFIKRQSGAQFPVQGVVYEDMYTKNFYEPYIFKDGVTVYVADSTKMPADKHCTDEQLEFYLHMTNADLKPNTGRYARICSTNRTQYYKNGGKTDVGDNDEHRSQSWLNVVRQLYQLAWLSDRNELMIAWAKEQL